MSSRNITSLIRENKTVFIIIAVALFLIELEIFAVAAMKSGKKSWLQVIDSSGNLIHETDGKSLSDFNKYYFEKTFGPFEDYQVKLVSKEYPFPFRAWFVAAVGIPVGVILLFAFIVKAYIALFYGEDDEKKGDGKEDVDLGLAKVITVISRFNIFTIGFLIFLTVFSYWVVPEVVKYVGKVGEETIMKYKWFFLAGLLSVLGFIIWIVYLKYLLAKKTIDSQVEVDKYRMQLQIAQHTGSVPQLAYNNDNGGEPPKMMTWEEPPVTIIQDGDTDTVTRYGQNGRTDRPSEGKSGRGPEQKSKKKKKRAFSFNK